MDKREYHRLYQQRLRAGIKELMQIVDYIQSFNGMKAPPFVVDYYGLQIPPKELYH
jgi:hypothetical protein